MYKVLFYAREAGINGVAISMIITDFDSYEAAEYVVTAINGSNSPRECYAYRLYKSR